MRRRMLALLLAIGTVVGFAHGFASLHDGPGWDGPPCHRHEPPPAP
ncbi:MAG: hypothetical protein R3F59_01290 [Myxococcota bacterium]